MEGKNCSMTLHQKAGPSLLVTLLGQLVNWKQDERGLAVNGALSLVNITIEHAKTRTHVVHINSL